MDRARSLMPLSRSKMLRHPDVYQDGGLLLMVM